MSSHNYHQRHQQLANDHQQQQQSATEYFSPNQQQQPYSTANPNAADEELIDPNTVSPWGYYHNSSNAIPQQQQQQSQLAQPQYSHQHGAQHHQHHHTHSALYEAQGFHQLQAAAQPLQQPPTHHHHPQHERAGVVQHPGDVHRTDSSSGHGQGTTTVAPSASQQQPQPPPVSSSPNASTPPFFGSLDKNGRRFKSTQSSRTGSLDLDLETEKALLRQRQSMLASGALGADGPAGSHRSRDMARELSDFDIANGRSGKRLLQNKAHIAQHGDQIPISWGHLFKRPLIRQWLHNGRLYREQDEREPSRFELFFDLSFVGIVHLLADAAAESATAINVAKFVLTFHPAWSIWLDVRQFINTSGTDDVWQRGYILLMMILLAGYAANATGIKIENFGLAAHAAQLAGELAGGGHGSGIGEGHGGSSHGAGSEIGSATGGGHGEGSGAGSGHGESAAADAGEHARRLLVNHVGPWIVKRAGGGGGGEGGGHGGGEEAALPGIENYIGNGYYFLTDFDKALTSAIAFFLVAKCVRLILYLIYGAMLPKFRKALLLNGLALALIAAINIPLMFVTTPWLIITLWTTGILVEILSRYFIALGLQIMHSRQKHRGQTSYVPAASIEHIMERMVLFTILIIGEAILVANYTAGAGTYGLSKEFGRSALGVTLAFLICWLFFDADAARVFVHALRRNWFTSISFTNIHLPLCASLILMASSMHMLVANDEVEQGYLWFFSGSLATTVLCIAGIGMLHHSLDRHRSAMMPHHIRMLWRIIAAVLIACMPLRTHWSSMGFLGVNVAILAWLAAFETIGKVGAVGKRYDEKRANELKAARAALGTSDGGGSGGAGGARSAGAGSEAGYSMLERGEKSSDGHSMSRGATATSMAPLHPQQQQSPFLAPGEQSDSIRDRLFYRMRKLNKDWAVRAPRRASWHEYEDLTGAERGEEDVGIESELGKLEVKEVSSGQRWAYAV